MDIAGERLLAIMQVESPEPTEKGAISAPVDCQRLWRVLLSAPVQAIWR